MPKKSKPVKTTPKGSMSRGCFRKYAMGATHMVIDDKQASEIYAAGVTDKQKRGYNPPKK